MRMLCWTFSGARHRDTTAESVRSLCDSVNFYVTISLLIVHIAVHGENI